MGQANEVAFYNDNAVTAILAAQKALSGFDNKVILIAGGLDRTDLTELYLLRAQKNDPETNQLRV